MSRLFPLLSNSPLIPNGSGARQVRLNGLQETLVAFNWIKVRALRTDSGLQQLDQMYLLKVHLGAREVPYRIAKTSALYVCCHFICLLGSLESVVLLGQTLLC